MDELHRRQRFSGHRGSYRSASRTSDVPASARKIVIPAASIRPTAFAVLVLMFFGLVYTFPKQYREG